MRKESHKIPLCLVEIPHLNLVFVEERPDLHTPLQQTNEQILTTLKLKIEITHSYFPCLLLTEQK